MVTEQKRSEKNTFNKGNKVTRNIKCNQEYRKKEKVNLKLIAYLGKMEKALKMKKKIITEEKLKETINKEILSQSEESKVKKKELKSTLYI
jgi:hypothetical protein